MNLLIARSGIVERKSKDCAEFDLAQPPQRAVRRYLGSYKQAGFRSTMASLEMEKNVLTGTRLLSRAVREIYDGKLQPFGVGAIQYALLEVIGCTETMTRTSIAKAQRLDKSTLSRNLKLILSEGWVQEVRKGADGRTRPIALTEAGRQLLIDAELAWLAAQNEVKALLGQERFIAVMSSAERITSSSEIQNPNAKISEIGQLQTSPD